MNECMNAILCRRAVWRTRSTGRGRRGSCLSALALSRRRPWRPTSYCARASLCCCSLAAAERCGLYIAFQAVGRQGTCFLACLVGLHDLPKASINKESHAKVVTAIARCTTSGQGEVIERSASALQDSVWEEAHSWGCRLRRTFRT